MSLVSVSAFAVSCTDISSMLEELEYLDGRADAAAAWIAEMEQEASGLASILKAMTANDCIVDMDFVYDEETLEPLSCTIYFDKSDPVVIQLKGQGGDQGTEGDGGRKVMISAAQDDGIYYWTVNGSWLLDENGQKVKAVGIDGQNGSNGSNGNDGAPGQNGADGLDYVYQADDQLIRTDRLLIQNQKMNKVAQIARDIGRQPVLSFGNSSGDVSMHMYTISNNPYRSAAFMLLAIPEPIMGTVINALSPIAA